MSELNTITQMNKRREKDFITIMSLIGLPLTLISSLGTIAFAIGAYISDHSDNKSIQFFSILSAALGLVVLVVFVSVSIAYWVITFIVRMFLKIKDHKAPFDGIPVGTDSAGFDLFSRIFADLMTALTLLLGLFLLIFFIMQKSNLLIPIPTVAIACLYFLANVAFAIVWIVAKRKGRNS